MYEVNSGISYPVLFVGTIIKPCPSAETVSKYCNQHTNTGHSFVETANQKVH